MNWKDEAIGKLQKFEAIRQSLSSIPQEIAQLEVESVSFSRGISVLPSGSRNVRGQEQRVLNNLVLRQELQWSLDRARNWIETVSKALETLTPQQRQVLYVFFIHPDPNGLDGICQDLQLEKSSVYRHRDKALERFALAMYGAVESI